MTKTWTRQARTRTVLGVTLMRTAPDTWSITWAITKDVAGTWSFRCLDGERLASGAQEWMLVTPEGTEVWVSARREADGSVTEEWSSTLVESSLRSAVRTMLLCLRGDRRTRRVA